MTPSFLRAQKDELLSHQNAKDPPAPALRPCPFCGGPARLIMKYRDPKPLNWRVFCDNEDPKLGQLCPMDVFSDFESEREAIAAWNTRAPESA